MLISRSISAISSAATARSSAHWSHSRSSVHLHILLPPLDLGCDGVLTAQCHTGDLRDGLATECHGGRLLRLCSLELLDAFGDLGTRIRATTTTTARVLHQPARKTGASIALDLECLLTSDQIGRHASGDCSVNPTKVRSGNGCIDGVHCVFFLLEISR